jgi:hypothetical protein
VKETGFQIPASWKTCVCCLSVHFVAHAGQEQKRDKQKFFHEMGIYLLLITSRSTFVFNVQLSGIALHDLQVVSGAMSQIHFDCGHIVSIANISDYGIHFIEKDIAKGKLFYNRSNCL